jgi:uncharacterized membrane protein YidH (DUF202 family)
VDVTRSRIVGLLSSTYHQWLRSERALRLGRALPYSAMPRVLATGIVAVAVLGAALAVIDRLVR